MHFSFFQQASACLQLKDSQGNYFALNSSQLSYSCANSTLFTGYQTELTIPQSSFARTIIAGQYYQVCNADTRGNSYAVCSNPILVAASTQPSIITVLSPNGGEILTRGTVKTLQWNRSGDLAADYSVQKIRVIKNLSNSSQTIYPIYTFPAGSSQSTYNWTVDKSSDGTVIPDGSDYKLQVILASGVNTLALDESDSYFSISTPQTANLTITTSSPLPNGRVGYDYSADIDGSGDIGPYSWGFSNFAPGTLPPGLSGGGGLHNGLPQYGIAGVPTTAGIYTFTLLLGSKNQSTGKQFTLTVDPALTSSLSNLGLTASASSAFLPAGCTATSAYSITTGKPCR